MGGFFLGIAGTAFAVGVPFVNAWFPPERRGLAIGIFGAGMGGTAISALTTVKLFTNVGEHRAVPDHRRACSPSTPSPPGCSCVTRRGASAHHVAGTRLVANARLHHLAGRHPVRRRLRRVRRVLGLPAGLPEDDGPTPADAANRMAGFVVVAVVMRPVGGWLSDRFGPDPVLTAGSASWSSAPRSLPRTPLERHRDRRFLDGRGLGRAAVRPSP